MAKKRSRVLSFRLEPEWASLLEDLYSLERRVDPMAPHRPSLKSRSRYLNFLVKMAIGAKVAMLQEKGYLKGSGPQPP